jgi:hypothetical protein
MGAISPCRGIPDDAEVCAVVPGESWAKQTWKNPRAGYVLQLVAGGAAAWFWLAHASPGAAIAVLGAVAAIMSLRKDMGHRERWLWTVVVFALLFVELRDIRIDREQHDIDQAAARKEEKDSFTTIAHGIEASIQEGREHFDVTIQGMQGLLAEATGGNSYLYFKLGDISGPWKYDVAQLRKIGVVTTGPMNVMSTLAFPELVGAYPLHNVYASTVCTFGRLGDIDYGFVFPRELGRPRQSMDLQFPLVRDRESCQISINTSNGSYSQYVLFIKVGDKWVWGSRLYKADNTRPGKLGELIHQWEGKDFPKHYSEADWNKD